MVCERFVSLTGCNNCEYPVESDVVMTTLRSEAIARVCLYICQRECLETKIIDFESIKIKCSGAVSFRELTPDTNDKYATFKKNVATCGIITDKWYMSNPKLKGSLEGCIINGVSQNIEVMSNIYSLRQYFICLVKNLRNLTICEGMCSQVTVHKTVSKCEFQLGSCVDINKITDPMVLLNTLRSAVILHGSSLTENMCLNLSKVTISCNGTANIPDSFILTKDPSVYVKSKCVEILKYWIGRHHYHPDVLTVLEVKRECTVAKDYSDLVVALRNGISTIEGSIFFHD